jgi:formylglycine-generating enzyme required for sulfatase activity/uncharacterized caspase-like protein
MNFWRSFKARALVGALLAAALIGATPIQAATGASERRVALIIGNDIYTHLPALNNARKDAEDMALKLRELGFETILKVNTGRRDMHRSIRQFEAKLSDGATGLAFFAGHGIQSDGKNFLIPTDANIEVEDDLEAEALTAQHVLAAMERAGNSLNIVILDACRDNPLPKRTRSARRGLTVVGIPAGAKGTAILYAAGEGQTAEDGPRGGNGVFTGELLRALDEVGLSLEQVFKRVNRQVQRRTNNRQRPWSLVSLQGEFVFRGQGPTRPAGQIATPAPSANNEGIFWQSIQSSDDAASFKAYLDQFPNGTFAGLARIKLAKLTPSTEPWPPPPSFTVTALEQTMVVADVASLNVRDAPSGAKVGSLRGGAEVEVTGRAEYEGARWYRVAMGGGGIGFVFGKYLRERPVTPVVGVYPKPAPSQFRRSVGDVFRDCVECPEMMVVPAGEFMMGSEDGDDDEKPDHRVRIPRPFAAGKFEVTFSQWDACVSAGGCGGHRPDDEGRGRGRRPVTNVNWLDAKSYVEWLSSETGKRYRLLSEAEWEYVARAGTTTKYSMGNSISPSQANYSHSKGRAVPVGSYGANRFGLHDVHGNVWEWVEDCWNWGYHGAPRDGEARAGKNCTYRVVRGGSWGSRPWVLRSADRIRLWAVIRGNFFGFRVARTLSR